MILECQKEKKPPKLYQNIQFTWVCFFFFFFIGEGGLFFPQHISPSDMLYDLLIYHAMFLNLFFII